MQQCLRELFTQLCEDEYYQVTHRFVLTPDVQSYPLDTLAGGSNAPNVDIRAFDSITLNGRRIECISQAEREEARCSTAKGTPTNFEMWGGEMRFYPCPDDYCDVCTFAYRDVDCTMFDDVEEFMDNQTMTVRNWRTIDLPPEYHEVFYQCVEALTLGDRGDYAAADYKLGLASSALDAIKEKKDEAKEFRGFGTSGLLKSQPWCYKPNPCCDCGDYHEPPKLEQPWYADCLPVKTSDKSCTGGTDKYPDEPDDEVCCPPAVGLQGWR